MAEGKLEGLADAVQGALRPPQLITWLREDDTPENLTGTVGLSGWIRTRVTGAVRDIKGALTVTNGAAGEFLWAYAAEDVAEAGEFEVQISAEFPTGSTPARTFPERWDVRLALASD